MTTMSTMTTLFLYRDWRPPPPDTRRTGPPKAGESRPPEWGWWAALVAPRARMGDG